MRFGVQLFGAGSLYRKDPESFFEMLSRTGYRLVEPCISLDGLSGGTEIPGIFDIEELPSFADIWEKHGLSSISAHVFTQEPQNAADKLRQLRKNFGIRQFIIVSQIDISRESYYSHAEKLIRLADQLSGTDISLLLHNSAEEILTKLEGKTAYEWLLDACGGKVGAQPDVGWLLYAGEDPEAFLWRNKDRICSLHYKDFRTSKDGSLEETAIGTGLVDMEACFQFGRAMELPQFSDQDKTDEDLSADLKNTYAKFQSLTQCRVRTKSILCTCDTETGKVTRLHTFDRIIEAPNWHRDGDTLFYNSNGLIWNYRISEDREWTIESGECTNCNNDHVLSPDHAQLAVSHSAPAGWESRIYILPAAGGTPRLITPNAPSYLHGWSPDGTELAYCAFRSQDGHLSADVYSIPAEGGEEKQLTSNAAFNDGPEYDPSGQYIWFNSTRTGLMQIWRMKTDGSDQTQMTFEERNNWFAHISPDGKKVVYLSYSKEGLDASEHLPNMQVELWMMDPDGSNRRKILQLFGGQGSINVNSWSPDSRHFAFVAYELEHR